MKKTEKNVTINNVVTNEKENENDTINNVVSKEKKEITYTTASVYVKNRIANKEFRKEFATLNGARWMLLQAIGKMATTNTPFTYTVEEAKQIIDTNKEFITPTKSGKFTVNCLISFINKKIKEREKQEKENEKKDLLCSRQIKKNTKNLYSAGGLI